MFVVGISWRRIQKCGERVLLGVSVFFGQILWVCGSIIPDFTFGWNHLWWVWSAGGLSHPAESAGSSRQTNSRFFPDFSQPRHPSRHFELVWRLSQPRL